MHKRKESYGPETEKIMEDYKKYLDSFDTFEVEPGGQIWERDILWNMLVNFLPKYGYVVMKINYEAEKRGEITLVGHCGWISGRLDFESIPGV